MRDVLIGVIAAALGFGFFFYPVIAMTSLLLVPALPALAWSIGLVGWFSQRPGTATIWEQFSKYCATTMQHNGFGFDGHGFIVAGSGTNIVGRGSLMFPIPGTGYVIYVAGLVRPKPYDEFNDKDGFGDGVDIFLHEQQRVIKLTKAETAPGTTVGAKSVALDITAFYYMRPVNPELFAYKASRGIVAATDMEMRAVIKDLVQAHTADQVKAMKANSSQVWAWIGANCQRTISNARANGVEIVPDRVSIEDVGFQEEDQKAQAEEQRQQWKSRGEAQEIMGTLLAIAASRLGLKDGQVARAELDKTPEGKKRLDAMEETATNTVLQRKKAEAGGYREFNIPGLPEVFAAILAGFSKKGP